MSWIVQSNHEDHPSKPWVLHFQSDSSTPKLHFISTFVKLDFEDDSIALWISMLIFWFIIAFSANGFARVEGWEEELVSPSTLFSAGSFT